MLPFRGMQHLNLNASNMSDTSYLEAFTEVHGRRDSGHDSFLRSLFKTFAELSTKHGPRE